MKSFKHQVDIQVDNQVRDIVLNQVYLQVCNQFDNQIRSIIYNQIKENIK